MKLNRFLVLASFTLSFTGWLQADVVVPPDPSHFQISLNDNETFDPNGFGGWTGGTLTGTGINQTPEGGFPTDPVVTCFMDAEFGLVCAPPSNFEAIGPGDPFGGIRLGGPSTTITGDFAIPVNYCIGKLTHHTADSAGATAEAVEGSAGKREQGKTETQKERSEAEGGEKANPT